MTWPRGRYNGDRIVGVEVKIVFDVTVWWWCLPNRWGRCLAIGPLRIWIMTRYTQDRLPRAGVVRKAVDG